MTAATGNAGEEAQIRALIDDRARAVRAKDVNGAVSSSAPDILSFDVVNPLQHIGSDASRKRTEDWFSSFQGPIGYEIPFHIAANSLKQLEQTRGFARNDIGRMLVSILERESL